MYYFTPWKTNAVTINYLLKEVIIFIFTALFFLKRSSFVRESTWDLEVDKFVLLSWPTLMTCLTHVKYLSTQGPSFVIFKAGEEIYRRVISSK